MKITELLLKILAPSKNSTYSMKGIPWSKQQNKFSSPSISPLHLWILTLIHVWHLAQQTKSFASSYSESQAFSFCANDSLDQRWNNTAVFLPQIHSHHLIDKRKNSLTSTRYANNSLFFHQ